MTRKVAIVTGAGAGIGRVFATALHEDGAAVVVVDVDPAAAMIAAAEIVADGGEAIAVTADVRDASAIEGMTEAVLARYGAIDVLVNNAGRHLHTYAQPCSTIRRDLWDDLLAVNVTGTLMVTRACLEGLRVRPGGNIVNMASIAGVTAPTTAYGVSKAAVIALTVSLAAELGGDGIRVNAIAPGMVDSPAAMAELEPEFQERIIGAQRIQRLGRMADLVGALRYLTSDAASFVTGQTLVVDGGTRLRV